MQGHVPLLDRLVLEKGEDAKGRGGPRGGEGIDV